MSAPKPGPWKVASPANDSHAHDVFAADGLKLHHGFWGGKATAQLIAAAPDLLEALKEAIAYVEACSDDEAAAKDAARFRAAIAKAEGK